MHCIPLTIKVGSQIAQADALSCMRQLGTVCIRQVALTVRIKPCVHAEHTDPCKQKRQLGGQRACDVTRRSKKRSANVVNDIYYYIMN
jgi:hypothetical protein